MEEVMNNEISREELEEFRAYKERQEQAKRRKQMMDDYTLLVDGEIEAAYNELSMLSEEMALIKKQVFNNFATVIEMKTEQLGLGKKEGQQTHTFTNSTSSVRLTIGNYTLDTYRDTVEDGITMVTDYLHSLAKDETSGALVAAVMRLLSHNKSGQIKASRVLQLRRLAEESGSEQFLEGVKLIEESYRPQVSKSFIRLEVKDTSTGAWMPVSLNMSAL